MAYLSPDNMADAFAALERGGVSVIAGGTDWFPQAGEVLPQVSLLDVTGLPGFRGISKVPGGWRLGAATRWSDVVGAELPGCFDALKAAAREVGSMQIQNAGTLAGNLCNASPAADGMPPLLCLGAEVELVSRRGSRRLAVGEFVTGVRRTARLSDELAAAIYVPDVPAGTVAGFRKLGARRYLVISIAMVAASLRVEAGRIVDARVAVGACSPVARRLAVLEARLEGLSVGAALPVDVASLARLEPIADVRGSGEYRLEAVVEMVRRLLGDLVAQGVRADG
ncbi:FAD binding domain-containing protein [Cypionkella sp.]|uniref:FAD binding domain-containing protein n=1 Tax=Cypionkella sp. TaxID=2811411 RepID=UPI002ABCBFDA|nr:FAD binding domain-containing protein [Cypionkella sp.]MDZ4392212.1 FAD binding domain-containing protein [Cypionkella sp.]